MSLTERLARASAAHAWRVVGAWLAAVVVAVVVIGLLLGSALTSEGEITNDPESSRAYDLLGERLPPEPNPSYGDKLVIVRSDTLTADDGAFQAKVETVARALERTKATNFVQTFFRDHDPALQSPNGRASVVFIGMGLDPKDNIERVVDTALAATEARST